MIDELNNIYLFQFFRGESYMRNIYTIGHSTRSIDDFLDILEDNDVRCVIDVRSYPGSGAYPQYNKVRLKKKLNEEGIGYVHLPLLGGRRNNKISYETGLRNKSFSSYAEYMLSSDFKKGMMELLAIARKYRSVIMCSEAVYWRCHRRMISDQLELWGYKVYHLGMGKKPLRHEVWDLARLNSKKQVVYDA